MNHNTIKEVILSLLAVPALTVVLFFVAGAGLATLGFAISFALGSNGIFDSVVWFTNSDEGARIFLSLLYAVSLAVMSWHGKVRRNWNTTTLSLFIVSSVVVFGILWITVLHDIDI